MPGGSSSSRPAAAGAAVTWRTWAGEVGPRVRAHWRLKAALAGAMTFLFCVPYFLLGRFPVFPVRELPLTWVDRAVGFHPYEWVWAYQSVYVLVNVVPWLADRRSDLRRYAAGFALLAAVSFAAFLFFPIRAPKPPVVGPTGMYRLLLWYDVPLNSLPSLHAGLLVYTLCFGRRAFGRRLPPGLPALAALWAAAILYATVATKEHYAVDIAAGAGLAVVADRAAWRRARGAAG